MNDAVARIVGLERRVMWRQRLLSLQDVLVLALTIGGLIAAVLVLVMRLRPIAAPSWAIISAAMVLLLGVALTRWCLTRARAGDAAFLIDDSLNLDDRVATSRLIIQRGGPVRAFEEALVEDAAARLGNQRAANVVPFRTPRWYALSLVSIAGLAAALTIPPRSLPNTDALTAERADIESAGEHLEQTAGQVEQAAPEGTETATLAKEQAEVGRGFRRSTASRAEALRRLGALEERIRGRHDDLASTHADEIVSLADRRLGDALSKLTTTRRKRVEQDETRLGEAEGLGAASKREPNKETQTAAETSGDKSTETSLREDGASGPPNSRDRARTRTFDQPGVANAKAKERSNAEPQRRPQEPVSGERDQKAGAVGADSTQQDSGLAKGSADQRDASTDRGQRPSEAKDGDEKPGLQGVSGRKADDQQAGEQAAGTLDALKSVPDSLTEQAGKALPKMSQELLKKAAELRANELSPADIERLRKAAEALSRDLLQIAQSKALQQALHEMARQVRPEQIEQVARELGNQEKLKQELEAAARLLSENQQAREMIAGLAGQFARTRDERRKRERSGGEPVMGEDEKVARDQGSPSDQANRGAAPEKAETAADRQLAGQGRESGLKGKRQRGPGGEYLYLQSKAGVGAARAPYSSAYPQYRREAERSVQRSQVPPNLRSVVRKYFDAINPEAKR